MLQMHTSTSVNCLLSTLLTNISSAIALVDIILQMHTSTSVNCLLSTVLTNISSAVALVDIMLQMHTSNKRKLSS